MLRFFVTIPIVSFYKWLKGLMININFIFINFDRTRVMKGNPLRAFGSDTDRTRNEGLFFLLAEYQMLAVMVFL